MRSPRARFAVPFLLLLCFLASLFLLSLHFFSFFRCMPRVSQESCSRHFTRRPPYTHPRSTLSGAYSHVRARASLLCKGGMVTACSAAVYRSSCWKNSTTSILSVNFTANTTTQTRRWTWILVACKLRQISRYFVLSSFRGIVQFGPAGDVALGKRRKIEKRYRVVKQITVII